MEPNFPRLRRLDTLWYRGEQLLCGVMFVAMAAIVFAAVVRDIFGTRNDWFDAVLLFGFTLAAVRTRVVKEGERRRGWGTSVAIAAGISAVIIAVVKLYVEALPGGFIWAPKMALCLMLWVAFLGASMATYEKAHLALEFGEKLWPSAIVHVVRAFAHALTSAFCLVLMLLSIHSLAEHYRAWDAANGFADYVPSMPWLPQWAVYLVFPYVFAMMALRLAAQTYTVATKTAQAPKEQLPT